MNDSSGARGQITAVQGVVTIDPHGLPVVGLDLQGTWVATLEVEETIDGDEWASAKVYTLADVAASATITTNVRVNIDARGKSGIRVRATAFTSAPTVVMHATQGQVGGASGGGGGGAATIADGADTAEGTTTDAGIITDSNGTVIGFLRGAIKMWINFLARFPTSLGAKTAAASLPVTLATDGQFVTSTGSLTEAAPATDTASSGLNGRLQRIAQRLTSLIAQIPAALGSTTAANSLPVTLSTDGQFVTSTGSLTEAAPASDTASSGLNGRLQRIAQRLTSLLALASLPKGVPAGSTGPFNFGLTYSAAQTNVKLITVSAGSFIYLTRATIKVSKAVTLASVAARFGFHASTTPAQASCVDGHPGIDPGGGFNTGDGSATIGKGGDGDDLMFDAAATTGGTAEVYGTYWIGTS